VISHRALDVSANYSDGMRFYHGVWDDASFVVQLAWDESSLPAYGGVHNEMIFSRFVEWRRGGDILLKREETRNVEVGMMVSWRLG
jgi:hypothetical protein